MFTLEIPEKQKNQAWKESNKQNTMKSLILAQDER